MVIPLYLACVTMPAYALCNVQEGISRSYDWIGLAMMPGYIVRQLLLTVLMAAAYFAGLPMNAVTAMIVAGVSIWLPTLAQLLLVNRRLATRIEKGPKAYEFRPGSTTALPILMVEGFYSLLAYTDVLVLQYVPAARRGRGLLREPPRRSRSSPSSTIRSRPRRRIASAAITSPATAQGCPPSSPSPSNGRSGRRSRPPCCCCIFGRPMLSLFGPQFTDGYHLMFILAAGLLARAAIGPIERLLNMLGEQRVCAMVYAGAFALNLVLCFVLIPLFGMAGAAIATASALIFESILLFVVTKNRLGFHVFIWGRAEQELRIAVHGTIDSLFRVEWRPLAELGAIAADWRALAGSALEPNVFYEPAFALAARRCSAATSAPAWSGRARRRRGCSAFSRRGSNAGATASRCRCWSAGPIPTPHSARRLSIARQARP